MSVLRMAWPVGHRLSMDGLVRHNFLRPQTVTLQVLAAISSKANMMGYKRPKPFPYKEKKFTLWHHMYDKTTHRFDDNSKVIIVDGPIAAGKSTFAKQLAEDLDMKHFPEASHDDHYINPYGFDMRQMNKEIPPSVQLIDVKDFYRDPHHVNVPTMQLEMLTIRFEQYFEALAHLFNTGQGVILERSLYSDFVFMEAMFEEGYISSKLRTVYRDYSQALSNFIQRPHLVIYLDVPVDIVKKRIKERNREWEVNTKVLTDKYLGHIERQYKTNFLRRICEHAEVVIYDWSNYGDAEIVVEDIERIDFEKIKRFEPTKFSDWDFEYEADWALLRMRYTNEAAECLTSVWPNHLIPELIAYTDDVEKFLSAYDKVPGNKYTPGYNPEMGDKVWFKS